MIPNDPPPPRRIRCVICSEPLDPGQEHTCRRCVEAHVRAISEAEGQTVTMGAVERVRARVVS